MRSPVPAVFATALAALLLSAPGCSKQQDQAPPEEAAAPEPTPAAAVTTLDALPEGTNAVQQEMRLLNEAMHVILTAIANDALEAIPGQIKHVHSARQVTDAAIEQGVYQPPANGDDLDGFVALDEAFHDDLKALLQASMKDDLEAATRSYGRIVQGCTGCHTQYRFPGGRLKQGP